MLKDSVRVFIGLFLDSERFSVSDWALKLNQVLLQGLEVHRYAGAGLWHKPFPEHADGERERERGSRTRCSCMYVGNGLVIQALIQAALLTYVCITAWVGERQMHSHKC